MYLNPTEYPEPVRDHKRDWLETVEPLPADADWATLDRDQQRVELAMWIASGEGPYAAVHVFYETHGDLAGVLDGVGS
jgi:hypothetical protein